MAEDMGGDKLEHPTGDSTKIDSYGYGFNNPHPRGTEVAGVLAEGAARVYGQAIGDFINMARGKKFKGGEWQ